MDRVLELSPQRPPRAAEPMADMVRQIRMGVGPSATVATVNASLRAGVLVSDSVKDSGLFVQGCIGTGLLLRPSLQGASMIASWNPASIAATYRHGDANDQLWRSVVPGVPESFSVRAGPLGSTVSESGSELSLSNTFKGIEFKSCFIGFTMDLTPRTTFWDREFELEGGARLSEVEREMFEIGSP